MFLNGRSSSQDYSSLISCGNMNFWCALEIDFRVAFLLNTVPGETFSPSSFDETPFDRIGMGAI
jgi:hypothetical protein